MKLNYRNEKTARFIASQYNKPLDKPDWYIVNQADDDSGADIYIYDYVGWPFNDARDFVMMVSKMEKIKSIRINSPGGDVFDANAIFNAILNHPSRPETIVESLAASAASYLLVAGSKKKAYKNAMIMIHEPMTGIWGNQYDFGEVVDVLHQISENMVEMYADHTNIGKRDLKAMMKAETWINAKKAKELGFIDEIITAGSGVKAAFDLSVFSNIPDDLKADTPKPKLTEREIEKILRDGGVSNKRAKAILAGCKDVGGTEPEGTECESNQAEEESESLSQWDADMVAQLTQNIKLLKEYNHA